MTPAPVVSTAIPDIAGCSKSAGAAAWAVLFDRRVLTLLVMGCLVGLMAGWANSGPREPRVRLLNKPKKTHLEVLVPAGPPPRLIPSDAPNAARARWARAPVPRQTPDGATRAGIVDYIAAFADPARASEQSRIDYVLLPSEGEGDGEPVDPPADLDESVRQPQ
jgi:hypothetical protein